MKKGIVCALVAAFLFSSMEIAIKMTGGVYHPLQLNFLRFFIGGLILLPMAHRQNRKLPLRLPMQAYLFYALTGLVCVVVSMTLFLLALNDAAASTVAIIFSCNSFFGIMIAAVFLRERVSRTTLGALFVCMCGLLLIINPLQFQAGALGVVLSLLCALTFAIYANMLRYGQMHFPYTGLLPTAYTFLFGSAELLLLIGLSHWAPAAHLLSAAGLEAYVAIPVWQGISSQNILLLLYIAVFVSGLGYAAHALAIEFGSMTISSLTFFLKPALAPMMAFLALGEMQTWVGVLGIAVLALGSGGLMVEKVCVANDRPLPLFMNGRRLAGLILHGSMK